jgi:predicted GIY-YIG superfamily endonuclease
MKSASIHHSSFNLQAFFQKFGLFADAPGAVARMRELVLRVAFSGGLSGKRMTEVGVPKGWESRTIASISSLITPGFACSRSHQVENGYVHLRTHNISTLGTLNFDLLVRIDPQMVDPQKASIRAGEILFNNTNSQELVGKTCLVDRDYEYGFSNHITRIRLNDGIFPGFVVFYFTLLRNSGYFARLCTRWINQAAVNTDTLKKQMIPLPPLAEQKRIVAKVDQLMALLDELEAQQKEREEKKAALVRASLARFADAPTPANLNCIFHSSYNIPPSDLRKSILTLAVQGKLVPPACRQAGKTPEEFPPPKPGKWWVYVLRCDDGSFYKGFTDDLPKRWRRHLAGNGTKWTKQHPPVELFYWEEHWSEASAVERERYLKSGSGREWFQREIVANGAEHEPASVLLERIREEREQAEPKQAGKRVVRKGTSKS